MNLVHHGARPQGRPQLPLAPRPARHPAGQQARAAPGAQGPRLGRRHRGAQEHEPRLGQQRRPVAQHARHQRLQPVHPRRSSATRSSARSASCRSWTASRGVFQKGPFGRNPEFDLGVQRPLLRDRPGGDGPRRVDGSSTPSARRRASRPSPRPASSALDPLGTEGFDVRQPQHIPLAANLGLGIFDFKSPRGRRHSIDHRVVAVG